MTVYVDDAKIPFRNMLMCHCWADSLEELFAMMDTIGVQRKWIQGHPTLSLPSGREASWVHFDISLEKKARAIRRGAVLTDRFEPLAFKGRQMIAEGEKRGNDAMIHRGRQLILLAEEARSRRAAS